MIKTHKSNTHHKETQKSNTHHKENQMGHICNGENQNSHIHKEENQNQMSHIYTITNQKNKIRMSHICHKAITSGIEGRSQNQMSHNCKISSDPFRNCRIRNFRIDIQAWYKST